jgi:hypothetical protein
MLKTVLILRALVSYYNSRYHTIRFNKVIHHVSGSTSALPPDDPNHIGSTTSTPTMK